MSIPRKAQVSPNVLFAANWVVPTEAVHDKMMGLSRIQLDAERAILRAVARARSQNLIPADFSPEDASDFR
jgi:hypothetical protein